MLKSDKKNLRFLFDFFFLCLLFVCFVSFIICQKGNIFDSIKLSFGRKKKSIKIFINLAMVKVERNMNECDE